MEEKRLCCPVGSFSLTCLPLRFKSTHQGEFTFHFSFCSSWYGVSYFILPGLDVFICEMGLMWRREGIVPPSPGYYEPSMGKICMNLV